MTGALPTGAALIASHHKSAFDTLVWLTLVPRAAYVMKQEMLRIPLFGALTRPAGMIAVDREGGAKAMRGLLRDAARAVAEQRQIVIFPEGTRAAPGDAAAVAAGHRGAAPRHRAAGDPGGDQLGAVLGAAGVPQASGGDPDRAAAADPGGHAAAGIAAAAGGGAANRRGKGRAACGQVCGLTLCPARVRSQDVVR